MCGFLGQIKASGSVNKINFSNALQVISHRGPDANDIKILSERAYLGHHRLAILDLDDSSNQPFESACKNFILVYNGEIYNYIELRKELQRFGIKFRTKSDTEVLLNGLIHSGKDFLNKLEGMFAFAFINKEKGSLICARDAFGIKPFYYNWSNEGIVFSSEIMPLRLLSDPGDINSKIIEDFILDGSYDHSTQTFFNNIMSLGAGECLNYSLETNQAEISKWFAYSSSGSNSFRYDDIVLQTREILVDSVRKHLRSDVPISLALSGGLDSSGITGIVKNIMPDSEIQTFSYVPESASISEEDWIDLAVRHNNVKSYKVKFQKSNGIDDLIATIKAHQEPFGSSSMVAQYKIFEAVKASGVKVTLDGQGADELFCGYTGYLSSTIIGLLRQKRFDKLSKILNLAISNKGIKFVLRAIAMSGIQMLPSDVSNMIAGYYHPKSLLNCFDHDPCLGRNTSIPSIGMGRRGLRESLNFATFEHGLPSLLRHADRSSMAHSIESRVPYLHTPLFNYINTIPDHFLFGSKNRPKGLLFDVLEPFIPKALYNRHDKVGFFADEWSLLSNNISDILDHFDPNIYLPNINIKNAKELVYKASKRKDSYQPYHWRIITIVIWASYCVERKPSS